MLYSFLRMLVLVLTMKGLGVILCSVMKMVDEGAPMLLNVRSTTNNSYGEFTCLTLGFLHSNFGIHRSGRPLPDRLPSPVGVRTRLNLEDQLLPPEQGRLVPLHPRVSFFLCCWEQGGFPA